MPASPPISRNCSNVGAGARGLQQPEHALDGHVDDALGVLFAGRQVQKMSDPDIASSTTLRCSIGPLTTSEARPRRQLAVVTQRANRERLEPRIAKNL